MHGPTFTATRTAFLDGLTVASAAALDWVASAAGGTRLAQFRALGGAVRHAPAGSTSYGHRDTPVLAFLSAASPDPSDSAVQDQAVDRLGRGLQLRRSGAYVTFLGTGAEEAVRAAQPPASWHALRQIKATYDPGNLFRHTDNIPLLVATERETA